MRRVVRSIRKRAKRLLTGTALRPGDPHHRAFVGPPRRYDRVGRLQLETLERVGLKPENSLLDIGCGSLRGGKLFIPFLEPDRYFGIEPNKWLVEAGIEKELGSQVFEHKRPTFSADANFTLTTFGVKFDFMIAQSIFRHAAPAQIARCLSEAKEALAPGGILVANFVEEETDYDGDEWVYPECCGYTLGFFESLAAEKGLRCDVLELEEPWPGKLTVVQIRHAGA